MKKLHFTILLYLLTIIGFGQTKYQIVDIETKEKVPYVNISVENEDIGATSNEEGIFVLKDIEDSKILIFSVPGYVTKRVKFKLIGEVIKLIPQTIQLNEVVLKHPKKRKKEKIIDKLKISKVRATLPGFLKRTMVARYYKYHEEYSQTPFLKKIRILTEADFGDSNFNIRLYSMNEKGEPGTYIYDKNIMGVAKQGKKITEIDISELNIEFPRNGFFVAVEWLILESNKRQLDSLAPEIGFTQEDTDINSWQYRHGTWKKIWKNSGEKKYYKDKYNLLAAEITLTN